MSSTTTIFRQLITRVTNNGCSSSARIVASSCSGVSCLALLILITGMFHHLQQTTTAIRLQKMYASYEHPNNTSMFHIFNESFTDKFTTSGSLINVSITPYNMQNETMLVLLSANMPTRQFTTDNDNSSLDSSRAVDGIKSSNKSDKLANCARTGKSSDILWWQVDLQSPQNLERVEITGAPEGFNQNLENFYIYATKYNITNFKGVEYGRCGPLQKKPLLAGTTISYPCFQKSVRYVTVFVDLQDHKGKDLTNSEDRNVKITDGNQSNISTDMILCEVEVYGYSLNPIISHNEGLMANVSIHNFL